MRTRYTFCRRSRRPVVLWRFHFINTSRLRESRSWVVSFSISGPFGLHRVLHTGTTTSSWGTARSSSSGRLSMRYGKRRACRSCLPKWRAGLVCSTKREMASCAGADSASSLNFKATWSRRRARPPLADAQPERELQQRQEDEHEHEGARARHARARSVPARDGAHPRRPRGRRVTNLRGASVFSSLAVPSRSGTSFHNDTRAPP